MSNSEGQLGSGLTRRRLLTSGTVALAGGAAALGLAGSHAQATTAVPESWDEEFDVVIIGSGFAGLAAAHEAVKAGASVVVLEKMRVPGGNSIINGGIWSLPGTPIQQAAGIEDSPDVMVRDMMAAGLDINHVALARKVAEESLDALMWSIDELGVEYLSEGSQLGGHSVPRSYTTHVQSGSGIVTQQLANLRQLGVEPRTETIMRQLLRDDDGRIKGVAIGENYRHPEDNDDPSRFIKAKRAVVLASGGFGADVGFRTAQDPRLTEAFDATNQPGSTSEALRQALSIGCTPVQLSWIQLGPWTSPDERGMGLAWTFALVCAQWGLWVDTLTGRRVVNELADRKTRADALIAAGNQGIAFCDAGGYRYAEAIPDDRMERLLEREVVRRFDSLEAMAAAYDMPLEPLQQTIDQFNASVDTGKDAEFGRYLQADQFPIGEPPFYVSRLAPKIHHTMGGVAINTEAQALDIVTGEPIPGLYAAGEVTGGVHGASRLGGVAVGDCLVFGRTAGRNAAAEPAWDA
ncbi:MAG: flavocytochrome c [Roseitalea sp.]|jgi:flavocytochrome c|nr:flavocytochrome c [Roseitalea sp.]MBO6722210.1 flavocytochrome c [Roseitalea sp.]MBO6744999.1 flavocytochrome c [Roseitalea sp.]